MHRVVGLALLLNTDDDNNGIILHTENPCCTDCSLPTAVQSHLPTSSMTDGYESFGILSFLIGSEFAFGIVC